jgi:hypothetical protein
MFLLKKSTFLAFGLLLVLTLSACGGGSDDDPISTAKADCIIGTSTIGNCTI